MTTDIIRVAAQSRTSAVAGAIAGKLREERQAIVQAIGAGAVNQAIKATVLARSFVADDGLEVFVIPDFADVDIEGAEKTALRFVIHTRHTGTHGD
ncbi:MAG: stage V sporulation protein S [Caldilineaceae bacterium]|nr:stage V sporulation protein S [Caldilineaceae bacterium]